MRCGLVRLVTRKSPYDIRIRRRGWNTVQKNWDGGALCEVAESKELGRCCAHKMCRLVEKSSKFLCRIISGNEFQRKRFNTSRFQILNKIDQMGVKQNSLRKDYKIYTQKVANVTVRVKNTKNNSLQNQNIRPIKLRNNLIKDYILNNTNTIKQRPIRPHRVCSKTPQCTVKPLSIKNTNHYKNYRTNFDRSKLLVKHANNTSNRLQTIATNVGALINTHVNILKGEQTDSIDVNVINHLNETSYLSMTGCNDYELKLKLFQDENVKFSRSFNNKINKFLKYCKKKNPFSSKTDIEMNYDNKNSVVSRGVDNENKTYFNTTDGDKNKICSSKDEESNKLTSNEPINSKKILENVYNKDLNRNEHLKNLNLFLPPTTNPDSSYEIDYSKINDNITLAINNTIKIGDCNYYSTKPEKDHASKSSNDKIQYHNTYNCSDQFDNPDCYYKNNSAVMNTSKDVNSLLIHKDEKKCLQAEESCKENCMRFVNNPDETNSTSIISINNISIELYPQTESVNQHGERNDIINSNKCQTDKVSNILKISVNNNLCTDRDKKSSHFDTLIPNNENNQTVCKESDVNLGNENKTSVAHNFEEYMDIKIHELSKLEFNNFRFYDDFKYQQIMETIKDPFSTDNCTKYENKITGEFTANQERDLWLDDAINDDACFDELVIPLKPNKVACQNKYFDPVNDQFKAFMERNTQRYNEKINIITEGPDFSIFPKSSWKDSRYDIEENLSQTFNVGNPFLQPKGIRQNKMKSLSRYSEINLAIQKVKRRIECIINDKDEMDYDKDLPSSSIIPDKIRNINDDQMDNGYHDQAPSSVHLNDIIEAMKTNNMNKEYIEGNTNKDEVLNALQRKIDINSPLNSKIHFIENNTFYNPQTEKLFTATNRESLFNRVGYRHMSTSSKYKCIPNNSNNKIESKKTFKENFMDGTIFAAENFVTNEWIDEKSQKLGKQKSFVKYMASKIQQLDSVRTEQENENIPAHSDDKNIKSIDKTLQKKEDVLNKPLKSFPNDSLTHSYDCVFKEGTNEINRCQTQNLTQDNHRNAKNRDQCQIPSNRLLKSWDPNNIKAQSDKHGIILKDKIKQIKRNNERRDKIFNDEFMTINGSDENRFDGKKPLNNVNKREMERSKHNKNNRSVVEDSNCINVVDVGINFTSFDPDIRINKERRERNSRGEEIRNQVEMEESRHGSGNKINDSGAANMSMSRESNLHLREYRALGLRQKNELSPKSFNSRSCCSVDASFKHLPCTSTRQASSGRPNQNDFTASIYEKLKNVKKIEKVDYVREEVRSLAREPVDTIKITETYVSPPPEVTVINNYQNDPTQSELSLCSKEVVRKIKNKTFDSENITKHVNEEVNIIGVFNNGKKTIHGKLMSVTAKPRGKFTAPRNEDTSLQRTDYNEPLSTKEINNNSGPKEITSRRKMFIGDVKRRITKSGSNLDSINHISIVNEIKNVTAVHGPINEKIKFITKQEDEEESDHEDRVEKRSWRKYEQKSSTNDQGDTKLSKPRRWNGGDNYGYMDMNRFKKEALVWEAPRNKIYERVIKLGGEKIKNQFSAKNEMLKSSYAVSLKENVNEESIKEEKKNRLVVLSDLKMDKMDNNERVEKYIFKDNQETNGCYTTQIFKDENKTKLDISNKPFNKSLPDKIIEFQSIEKKAVSKDNPEINESGNIQLVKNENIKKYDLMSKKFVFKGLSGRINHERQLNENEKCKERMYKETKDKTVGLPDNKDTFIGIFEKDTNAIGKDKEAVFLEFDNKFGTFELGGERRDNIVHGRFLRIDRDSRYENEQNVTKGESKYEIDSPSLPSDVHAKMNEDEKIIVTHFKQIETPDDESLKKLNDYRDKFFLEASMLKITLIRDKHGLMSRNVVEVQPVDKISDDVELELNEMSSPQNEDLNYKRNPVFQRENSRSFRMKPRNFYMDLLNTGASKSLPNIVAKTDISSEDNIDLQEQNKSMAIEKIIQAHYNDIMATKYKNFVAKSAGLKDVFDIKNSQDEEVGIKNVNFVGESAKETLQAQYPHIKVERIEHERKLDNFSINNDLRESIEKLYMKPIKNNLNANIDNQEDTLESRKSMIHEQSRKVQDANNSKELSKPPSYETVAEEVKEIFNLAGISGSLISETEDEKEQTHPKLRYSENIHKDNEESAEISDKLPNRTLRPLQIIETKSKSLNERGTTDNSMTNASNDISNHKESHTIQTGEIFNKDVTSESLLPKTTNLAEHMEKDDVKINSSSIETPVQDVFESEEEFIENGMLGHMKAETSMAHDAGIAVSKKNILEDTIDKISTDPVLTLPDHSIEKSNITNFKIGEDVELQHEIEEYEREVQAVKNVALEDISRIETDERSEQSPKSFHHYKEAYKRLHEKNEMNSLADSKEVASYKYKDNSHKLADARTAFENRQQKSRWTARQVENQKENVVSTLDELTADDKVLISDQNQRKLTKYEAFYQEHYPVYLKNLKAGYSRKKKEEAENRNIAENETKFQNQLLRNKASLITKIKDCNMRCKKARWIADMCCDENVGTSSMTNQGEHQRSDKNESFRSGKLAKNADWPDTLSRKKEPVIKEPLSPRPPWKN